MNGYVLCLIGNRVKLAICGSKSTPKTESKKQKQTQRTKSGFGKMPLAERGNQKKTGNICGRITPRTKKNGITARLSGEKSGTQRDARSTRRTRNYERLLKRRSGVITQGIPWQSGITRSRHTGSITRSTSAYFPRKVEDVQFAEAWKQKIVAAYACTSITATQLEKLGEFSALHATWGLGNFTMSQQDWNGLPPIYGAMPLTDNPIATAQREQREAAARYIVDGHPLAELGMGDWFAEEFLLTQEGQS
jgi:hypothetical protein